MLSVRNSACCMDESEFPLWERKKSCNESELEKLQHLRKPIFVQTRSPEYGSVE